MLKVTTNSGSVPIFTQAYQYGATTGVENAKHIPNDERFNFEYSTEIDKNPETAIEALGEGLKLLTSQISEDLAR